MNVPKNAPANEPITAPRPKKNGAITIASINEKTMELIILNMLVVSLLPAFTLKKNSATSPERIMAKMKIN